MTTYSQNIEWHERDGSLVSYGVSECDSRVRAITVALAIARDRGWNPPRWWQWWRWGDYDYTKLEDSIIRMSK